jgi:hypothetical protein
VTTDRRGRGVRVAVLALAVGANASCAAAQRAEGLDPEALPAAVRPDYEVFAQRCSRCHALSRPLDSGITDMEHWRNYVARMRRQPNSGIAPVDVPPILRFLEYYSAETLRRRGHRSSGGQL